MRQKKYTVIANWKMNPSSPKDAQKNSSSISKFASKLKKTDVVIAPSFVHLPVVKLAKGVSLGAQDVFWENNGPFTGFISTSQVKSLGVTHVVIGHSERRSLGETDGQVNKKIKSTLKEGLIPVICIGESEHDTAGAYLSFLSDQIKLAFLGVSRNHFSNIIIAYEPIWAIGKSSKDAMSPRKLHETVLYIQKVLGELCGREASQKVRIIYGGSVKEDNAEDLIRNGEVKGFLVGGASLSPDTFNPILKIVDSL